MLTLLKKNDGFTLIEIMVVIALLSMLTAVALPRATNFFRSNKESFAIMTGVMAKTFDDSYLKNRTNYVAVHMFQPDPGVKEITDREKRELFDKSNGISVLLLHNGEFVPNERKILSFRDFPSSFVIERVILPGGKTIESGTALIPYYPDGSSSDAIVHVTVDNEKRWSIQINKFMKEPAVIKDHITYSEGP